MRNGVLLSIVSTIVVVMRMASSISPILRREWVVSRNFPLRARRFGGTLRATDSASVDSPRSRRLSAR